MALMDTVAGLATRKFGPAPAYVWIVGGTALAYGGYKYWKSKSAGSATSGSGGIDTTGAGNQFTSSTDTQTTDPSGNTVDTSFSASGNGFLPGQLTTAASPMPFSAGDVYNNISVPVTTSTAASPTAPPTVPYVVTSNTNTIAKLVSNFYRVPAKDTIEQGLVAKAIEAANPQRTTWGSTIPTGTQINLPASYSHGATTTLSNGQQTTATGTKPVL